MTPVSTNSARMRPVYEWDTEGPPEEFVQRLDQLVSFDPAVDMQRGSKHCMLSIPIEARRTWSPTLDVRVSEIQGGRTHVFARMGPEPRVWTFFVFLYAAAAFPAMIGGTLGLVQWSLGDPPWGFLAIAGALVFWLLLYLASFVGRGLSADQIHQLLAVMDVTLSVDARDIADEVPVDQGSS